MRDGGGLDVDSNNGDDDKWKIQGYIWVEPTEPANGQM